MFFRTLAVLAALAVGPIVTASAQDAPKPGVTVTNAWARAMPAGATVGAAYLELTATTGDKLIAIASPVAGRAEIHTHVHDNGTMQMRRLESFELKPGEPRKLAPGGDHLMLFDVKAPLQQGGTLPLTLTFEKAGVISVEAKIEPIGAPGPSSSPDH
ncbi:MAG: copper chaperone PCu(A)C [Hyphomicrobium sp.]|jgi:hypothetical protein